jgi:hypothetical protein
MPGLLNDRLFHSEKMLGSSLAITIGFAAVVMLLAFRATYRFYRTHSSMLLATVE